MVPVVAASCLKARMLLVPTSHQYRIAHDGICDRRTTRVPSHGGNDAGHPDDIRASYLERTLKTERLRTIILPRAIRREHAADNTISMPRNKHWRCVKYFT
jgi:hypothetical protein